MFRMGAKFLPKLGQFGQETKQILPPNPWKVWSRSGQNIFFKEKVRYVYHGF